ncbi:MAG: hypothetical protein CMB80_03960 [Flammeovirgaceae bacterium]|nr:hypothetical protein [Flammeovirgaceae bacterium]MBE63235.1 hypothetical protein [Flammeovirgaceae bacterium]HCX20826.1 hypothetical protein [Cytophagales bacterium]
MSRLKSAFEIMQEVATFKCYSKKEKILDSDKISKSICAIQEGVVRHYVIDRNGNDKTLRISKEGDLFFTSIVSFFKNEPSYIICEALTDTKLLTWSKTQIDELASKEPLIEAFRYQKLIDFIVEKHKKEMSLMIHSAEDRYREFCEVNHELFNRIPHYVIASYLNMTPEMLSRIRKQSIS